MVNHNPLNPSCCLDGNSNNVNSEAITGTSDDALDESSAETTVHETPSTSSFASSEGEERNEQAPDVTNDVQFHDDDDDDDRFPSTLMMPYDNINCEFLLNTRIDAAPMSGSDHLTNQQERMDFVLDVIDHVLEILEG